MNSPLKVFPIIYNTSAAASTASSGWEHISLWFCPCLVFLPSVWFFIHSFWREGWTTFGYSSTTEFILSWRYLQHIQNYKCDIRIPATKINFLGPRGPLRTPSSVRPSARPSRTKNSKSPLKPYKAYQDLARPLI